MILQTILMSFTVWKRQTIFSLSPLFSWMLFSCSTEIPRNDGNEDVSGDWIDPQYNSHLNGTREALFWNVLLPVRDVNACLDVLEPFLLTSKWAITSFNRGQNNWQLICAYLCNFKKAYRVSQKKSTIKCVCYLQVLLGALSKIT